MNLCTGDKNIASTLCNPCPYDYDCKECRKDMNSTCDDLKTLFEKEETIKNLEQEIRDKNERLKERAEQVDSMLKEKEFNKRSVMMKDKQRLINFIDRLVPDDFECGRISVTFGDDGSAFITINNKKEINDGIMSVSEYNESLKN